MEKIDSALQFDLILWRHAAFPNGIQHDEIDKLKFAHRNERLTHLETKKCRPLIIDVVDIPA